MEINYCYGCMEPMEAGQVICPHCGLDNSQIKNDEGLLHTGTILNGKYLVGRVLGRGGFGVTYLGIELVLKIKVAIKEYFPNSISSRLFNSKLVTVQNKAVNSERFEKGKEAFQLEAETLAMFNTPGIAHVREYFRENNTAYIVMDYVDGAGLTQEIKRCGGRMPWQRVVDLTLPLIIELDQLHSKNLTHRDIKPDNIKIVRNRETGEERMVLLDFGAARTYVSSNLTKTYTQILTPGYAPIEQYQARTHLGPFTDIYAICATMYAAITGYKPAAAPDRMMGDDVLKPFAAYGLTDIPENVEKAIFHGMEISYKDRPQTMAELYRELVPQPPAEPLDPQEELLAEPVEEIVPAPPDAQGPVILPEEKPDAEQPAAEEFPEFSAPKPVKFTEPTATVQENGAFVKKYGKRIAVLLAVLLAAAGIIFAVRPKDKAGNLEKTQQVFSENVIQPTESPVDNTSEPILTDTPVPMPTGISKETATATSSPTPAASLTPTMTPTRVMLKPGDSFLFGRYEQDEAEGADPVEWQVLVVENDRALVISRYGLEFKNFHETKETATWASSDIREWLNGEFFDAVFNDAEKLRILDTFNSTPDSKWGTDGGEDTVDKIFLLSMEEAEKYFDSDKARICEPTFLANLNHTDTYNQWWLRSPGYKDNEGTYVSLYGKIFNSGFYYYLVSRLVRPVFWLDLSDTSGMMVTPGPTPTPTPTPKMLSLTTGQKITFGRYEQDGSSGAEPIRWQVLAVENGRALVISEYGLEAKAWGEKEYDSIWENSTVRTWLNNDFYTNAFSAEERTFIPEVTISNPDNEKYGTDGGPDTNDRIFLLSIDEAEKYFKDDQARECRTTYHAEQNRAPVYYNGYTLWWLRSPGHKSGTAARVNHFGEINSYGTFVSTSTGVVRPAFWLDLSGAAGSVVTPYQPAEPGLPAITGELKAGETYTFGSFEQDNKSGADPIEWQVLTVKNGRALLISRYGLEAGAYSSSRTSPAWENSSARTWLNGEFYNKAFTSQEKTLIMQGANGGNTASDRVFLLSSEEVRQYFKTEAARRCQPTYHAERSGGNVNKQSGSSWWWLRTSDSKSSSVPSISSSGSIGTSGHYADNKTGLFRPAVWVDLSKAVPPTATPTPTPVPERFSAGRNYSAGDIFTFGKYEQDDQAGPDAVEWQVLGVEDGQALVISRYALENKPYNDDLSDCTWETCTLREWLNGEFYDSVFTDEEKARVISVTNINPDNERYGTNGGNNTRDKIFLLSLDEVNTYFENDQARLCQRTAHVTQRVSNSGNVWWWLRSPGAFSSNAAEVSSAGKVYYAGTRNDMSTLAVRPVFWMYLSENSEFGIE